MRRRWTPVWLLCFALGWGCLGCSESNPSGPTVHCFDQVKQLNANVPTGKVQVTCPNIS